ncbi:EpsG family protein [Erysipelothrix sp. strain 2 (EsS2-7-Brazil)]|uniref:EpsG family protein n=1 Tax=Erysipelothrix sp. strain 2 (EsS2-7-Brazil) TaxID=2500579 RepID=UPI00190A86C3|nr:EpsG family protein [Erysipelothrix sp. strain 2 (EsS2-7-Brazil)]
MYYFSFIYLCAFLYFGKHLDSKKKFIVAALPFVLIIFLRFGVGADYFSYQTIYESIDPHRINESFASLPKIETLFKVLMLAGRAVGMNYHVFSGLLCTGILLVALLWIKDSSDYFEMATLLYFSTFFLYWNLGALRQVIVIVGSMYVYFNRDRDFDWKIKGLTTALLFFIHGTALIVPIIYIATKIKWNFKIFTIIFILFPLTRLVYTPAFFSIFENVPILSKFLLYSDAENIKILSVPFLLRFSIFAVTMLHYNKLIESYEKQKSLIDFVILNMLLYFYLPFSKVLGTRVTVFGYYGTVVVIPMILGLYKDKKLYKLAFVAILGFSGIQFYNELTKQVKRTGYEYSATRLNFETILQKNYASFNNMYAFEVQNSELVKVKVKDYQKHKMLTVYTQEALYDPNLAHLSVKFPDSEKVKKGEDYLTYGIVNEKGQIVELPTAKSRFKIYGPFVEETIGERTFTSKLYRKIGNPLVIDSELVRTEIENKFSQDLEREFKHFPMTIIHKHKVIENKELDAYNKNTVWRGASYKDLIFNDRSYYMIQTPFSNYFSIVDQNGSILTDKFYSSITPFDSNGIAIGTTKYSREYIDYDGNVIWMELYE